MTALLWMALVLVALSMLLAVVSFALDYWDAPVSGLTFMVALVMLFIGGACLFVGGISGFFELAQAHAS
ncbi:hypothetical protein CG471_11745 [Sphingobium sp. IP1]|uniref:hypothetical protein n=1 Tax=Sphingobium sp. IP1 TaxID=2021637 RepID=UPI000C07C066|nr:hypothetical protein [Sphingobium sp. IP1]PHP19525.1 hypothetical protein CG471_11745 [Sphingobium sp. IP1]